MPIFNDTEHMYGILGGLFEMLATDPVVGKKYNDENINLQFVINDPDGQIWLMHGDEKPFVALGDQDVDADIVMWISGDDCHRFWLQKLKLPVALAKRKVKAKGPMSKILGLLPLLKPAYQAYPKICEDNNLPLDV
jgi:hypothetical protein